MANVKKLWFTHDRQAVPSSKGGRRQCCMLVQRLPCLARENIGNYLEVNLDRNDEPERISEDL